MDGGLYVDITLPPMLQFTTRAYAFIRRYHRAFQFNAGELPSSLVYSSIISTIVTVRASEYGERERAKYANSFNSLSVTSHGAVDVLGVAPVCFSCTRIEFQSYLTFLAFALL